MRIAITGVSGYLGQLLARRLDGEPGVEELLGLDLRPSEFRSGKLRFERADLRTADFARLLRGYDALYHLAFIVDPPRRLSPAEVDEINVDGSRRVFEGAITAGVPKIVFASSMAVYGAHPDNPPLFDEEARLRPNEDWYYSRNKAQVEEILDGLAARHPRTIVIRFRPGILLGRTMRNNLDSMLSRRVLCAVSDHKRDICWDEDVAEAFRLALDYGRSDIFNLACDGPLSIVECGELLGRRVVRLRPGTALLMLRIAAALRLVPRGTIEWIVAATRGPVLLSTTRARTRLNWRPRYDGPAAVREYAKHRPSRHPL